VRHGDSPVNESAKQAADHNRRRNKRTLLVAALLITLLGAVAGAILVPQELARRDAQPIPTHSPMHRKPPRAGAAGAARTLPFARGVCWEAAGEIDSTDLDPLLRIRANWIFQTPFGWQRGPDTPEIRGMVKKVPHLVEIVEA